MRVRDIDSPPTGSHATAGGVVLTWLGQAGFILRSDDATVVIDPYLSDALASKYRGTVYPHTRLHPAPVDPQSLTDLDLVFCSHRHTDHMDPETLLAMATASQCRFVVPAAWTDRVAGFGIPPGRIVPAAEGETLHLGAVTVHPVLAAHEQIERDESGRSLYLGYVITLAGTVFYHSGDCVPYSGQSAAIAPLGVDVALLPVNGRDEIRTANGVPGNFHPAEAVELACQLDARVLVAHHFGLFDFNTVDVDALERAVAALPPGVAFLQPSIGRRYEVDGDD